MEVKVIHLDRTRFSIQSRSHTVICDQPAENGGGIGQRVCGAEAIAARLAVRVDLTVGCQRFGIALLGV